VCVCGCAVENLCTVNLRVTQTRLILSWAENRLLAYVKSSNSHSSNPPTFILTVSNWLIIKPHYSPNASDSQNFKYFDSIGALTYRCPRVVRLLTSYWSSLTITLFLSLSLFLYYSPTISAAMQICYNRLLHQTKLLILNKSVLSTKYITLTLNNKI
jgi:hypothetical protein